MMRKSLQDISFMVRDIPYPGPLPMELVPLHCYVTDVGHSILAVPECLLASIQGDPMMYEVPLPAKFVIQNGWRAIPGTDSISVDVEYDDMLGAVVPDGYDEF